MNLYRKKKQTHRLRKQTYSYQMKVDLNLGLIYIYTSILKIDNQQGPTV